MVCFPPLLHCHSFLPFFFFKVKYIEMHKSQLDSFEKWMHLHNPYLDGNSEYFHLPENSSLFRLTYGYHFIFEMLLRIRNS